MTSIYEKAINQLLGTSQEDLSGVEYASINGLIIGSMTEVERRKIAGIIADLEAKIYEKK